jgi:hypothetical protein
MRLLQMIRIDAGNAAGRVARQKRKPNLMGTNFVARCTHPPDRVGTRRNVSG